MNKTPAIPPLNYRTDDVSLSTYRWLRISAESPENMREIKKALGVEMLRALERDYCRNGEFSYFPVTVLSMEKNRKRFCRVGLLLSSQLVVSLEPAPSPAPLNEALKLLENTVSEAGSLKIFAIILQEINDANGDFLNALDVDVGKYVVWENQMLDLMQNPEKECIQGDVVLPKFSLDRIDSLLCNCSESYMRLILAAHHGRGRLPANDVKLDILFHKLIDAAETGKEHANFLRDDIRVLKSTKSLVLRRKYSKILKILAITLAFLLPLILIFIYQDL